MAARQLSTVDVPKGEYKNYREKGLQFFNVMKSCLQEGDWDAVVLNGVHTSISLSDALTVVRLGTRSSGKSHLDAAGLLSQAMAGDPEGRRDPAGSKSFDGWTRERTLCYWWWL